MRLVQITFSIGASTEGKNGANASSKTILPLCMWQIVVVFVYFMDKSLKGNVLVLKQLQGIVVRRVKVLSVVY